MPRVKVQFASGWSGAYLTPIPLLQFGKVHSLGTIERYVKMLVDKVADILTIKEVLIATMILVAIITVETCIIWELAMRVGTLRRFFSITAEMYKKRRHDAGNKQNNTEP